MTIAISLKVNDGVVLASDSATTILGGDPTGRTGVINIYENANKHKKSAAFARHVLYPSPQ